MATRSRRTASKDTAQEEPAAQPVAEQTNPVAEQTGTEAASPVEEQATAERAQRRPRGSRSSRAKSASAPATQDSTPAQQETVKTPAKPRRRSAGVTLETDEARFAEPEAAPSSPEPTATAATSRTQGVNAPRKKPWEREFREDIVVSAVRFPVSLRDRLDGVEDYLATHDLDEIPEWLAAAAGSQTNLFNFALHRLATQVEDELNGGKALPVLIRRRRKS